MVKIGLIGLGYLGKIHLKLLKEIGNFHISGIYDTDLPTTQFLAKEYQTKAFTSLQQLIEESDAIDIVTPSVTHFKIAKTALLSGKHIFLEKPATSTVQESVDLKKLAEEKRLVIQVGHVERFNPAFIAFKPLLENPDFIDCTRLAQYNPRGTDVSVTHDLMIHDLDLVLSLVKSEITKIEAHGCIQRSLTNDIVTAQLGFNNGFKATFTANRNASVNERKIAVFQQNTIIEADLLNKSVSVYEYINLHGKKLNYQDLKNENSSLKKVINQTLKIPVSNAIKEELVAFHQCIITATKPVVTIDDAIDALSLAYRIEEKTLHNISK